MNKLIYAGLVLAEVLLAVGRAGAACSSCGSAGGNSFGNDVGPFFSVSMGTASNGMSAGSLCFGAANPGMNLFTPAGVQYSGASQPGIFVATTPLVYTTPTTNVGYGAVVFVSTNFVTVNGVCIATNYANFAGVALTTNVSLANVTYTAIRQVYAPQALADIPTPPTQNGYAINYYYPSQVGSMNGSGVYSVSGAPYATWIITNSPGSTTNQVLVYETTAAAGLLKQWNFNYSPSTATWTMTTLAGIQENMAVTNASASGYTLADTLQYVNGPVARQTETVYGIFSWGVAPVQVIKGSGTTTQTTTYTYYDPSPAGNMALPETVQHPDGSWEEYNYDNNGNPTTIYSAYGDVVFGDTGNCSEKDLYYSPSDAGIPSSVDNGILHPRVARMNVGLIAGQEVARSYTVFPAANERLNIQCVTIGAAWNANNNLVTTNFYYSSGPNRFALKSVISPDGTMTVYNYFTNANYQTNITVTGRPDPTFSYIADGVSNVVVLNSAGSPVVKAAWDVASTTLLTQDTYGNFDVFGRPPQVTHLDGTVETTAYACCGLENTTDRDGVTTLFLYDADQRQYGYEKFLSASGNPITFENTLDPVGQAVWASRIGTNGSVIVQSGSAFDTAGRLIAQTNALGGVTTYRESNDPNTGGLIRTITYPDTGVRTEKFYADGTLKSVTGTGVHGVEYQYGVGTDVNGNTCTYTTETKLKADNSASGEWTTTFRDMAGRQTEVLYADGSYIQSIHNSFGQLWKQVDPDGLVTLYTYNGKGERNYTIQAILPATAQISSYSSLVSGLPSILAGSDRVSQGTNGVIVDHGAGVNRSQTVVWLNGQSSGTPASMAERSVNGLQSWQVTFINGSAGLTNQTLTTYAGSTRTVIATAPDGSYTKNIYSYGVLASSTRYDANNNVIGGTSYAYDPHGRPSQMTDARNGTTTYGYNAADQAATVTTPAPGGGGAAETTTTAYDLLLRPTIVTQPDGTTVYSRYLLTGELALQYGSRTYPVGYGYDYAGRMQMMTNWSGFSNLTGPRVTTWLYNGLRGWLTNKVYVDGYGPAYTYTPAGRLQARSWARTGANGIPITTTYVYDAAGGLTNILYSDSTPTVTNLCDRLGRVVQQRTANYQANSVYNLAGSLLSESVSGGPLNGLTVSNQYDNFLRRTNLAVVNSSGTILTKTAYGYDAASRLQTVNDGNTDVATYSYVANSPLVGQIALVNGSTSMMTTKQYDYLNRLTQISSQSSASIPPLSFNYSYNAANQRTKDKLADGSYWVYQYDALGQVTNGFKYFYDGTLVPGQQFGYAFDTIGNRSQTKAGGDQNGANQRLANYAVNTLNQITSRDYPGTNDVVGVALSTNSVTVNGVAAFHKWEYYSGTVSTNNSSSAEWEQVAVSSGGSTSMGGLYVPKTREQFAYDLDGNLLSDGRWNYTWDAENRLVAMTNNAGVGPLYGLTFTYDAKGRRIQKNVTTNGAFFTTLNFAYDGWNPIAILNSQSAILTAFTWGSDLSGSIQGAGGVGGLVSLSYRGTTTTNCFAAFDGNGNLAALVNAADGSLVASYEYGPFGEVIRATGPMAKTNPIRFSTKYQDDESDLLYYGYRYYKASTGTWLSSDPINEIGFKILTRRAKFVDRSHEKNLYSFVSNDSVGKFDILGLSAADVKAITDAFWKLFDEMCKSKKCCPEKGWIQNMPWSSTLGCTKQTQTVQDMLGNLLPTLKSGDSWDPEVAYKPLGEGNDPGPHNYSIMGSDNPADPVITLDTWHGCLITYTRDSTIAGDKGTTDDWKQWTSDPPGTEHPHYDMHKDCRRCDGKSNPPDPVLPPVRPPPWGLH